MIDRKPVPGSEDAAMRPSRYRARRTSSGRLLEDPFPLPDQSSSSVTPSSGDTSPSRDDETPDTGSLRDSGNSLPPTQTLPLRQRHIRDASDTLPTPFSAELSHTGMSVKTPEQSAEVIQVNGHAIPDDERELQQNQPPELQPQLQYFHEPYHEASKRVSRRSADHGNMVLHATEQPNRSAPELRVAADPSYRPSSTLTVGSGSDGMARGVDGNRHLSVGGSPSPQDSPAGYARGVSTHRYSPDSRPVSYIDLLHVPYPQQVAPAPSMDNSFLRNSVGTNASLLDTRKTLEMYRANVKKTNEPAIQYEFAVFMLQAAMEGPEQDRQEMLRESKQILQKLSDRGYPFAQYYLADGYASGLFSKGKEDHDRAFPLFVSASKHGHAEAGYRAALCYEFGWGCRRDYLKAAQFYRTAASKNHPGAATRLGMACLEGTMGLAGKYREGVKWLKRAAESADPQYNAAPYELARLHEAGFGDDIFKDEMYAAQLYTQSAELGHPEANLIMGKAYEHGLLMCPKDAALSIHFYTGAAQAGLAEAMMALCAWYLFGAEPILEKNENEAFEWAKRAADLGENNRPPPPPPPAISPAALLTINPGFSKAEYAVGYFKEIGIGCRQDSLEANVWYVRAAQQGEDRAKARLAIIRHAASGGDPNALPVETEPKEKKGLLSKLGL